MWLKKRAKDKKPILPRRWSSLLITLAALAFLIILLAFALFLLLKPYPLSSPEAFMAANSRLVVSVNTQANPHVELLIGHFLSCFNQSRPPQQKIELADINRLFKFLLYHHIYILVNYKERTKLSLLTVVNIKRLGWLFSAMTRIKRKETSQEEPAIARISDTALWYCLTGRNLFISNNKEELLTTSRTSTNRRQALSSSDLLEKSRLITGSHLAEGYLVNNDRWLEVMVEAQQADSPESSAATHLWNVLNNSELSLGQLSGIHFWADVNSPDTIDLTIKTRFTSPDSAERWQPAVVENLLPTLINSLPREVKVSHNSYQQGSLLILEISLRPVKTVIDSLWVR